MINKSDLISNIKIKFKFVLLNNKQDYKFEFKVIKWDWF